MFVTAHPRNALKKLGPEELFLPFICRSLCLCGRRPSQNQGRKTKQKGNTEQFGVFVSLLMVSLKMCTSAR